MVIESTDILESLQTDNRPKRSWPRVLSTFIILTVIVIFLLFVVSPAVQPTGSLLSPLPDGEIAEQTPTPTGPSIDESQPVIAAPETMSATDSAAANQAASAEKLLITLPANTREIVVRDAAVTADTYVYLVPISATNDPVYIKTKGEGYFTIAIDTPSTGELLLEYYVITE